MLVLNVVRNLDHLQRYHLLGRFELATLDDFITKIVFFTRIETGRSSEFRLGNIYDALQFAISKPVYVRLFTKALTKTLIWSSVFMTC